MFTNADLKTSLYVSLREKCLNTEFSLVRMGGKYGQEKTPYLDTFHPVFVFK